MEWHSVDGIAGVRSMSLLLRNFAASFSSLFMCINSGLHIFQLFDVSSRDGNTRIVDGHCRIWALREEVFNVGECHSTW